MGLFIKRSILLLSLAGLLSACSKSKEATEAQSSEQPSQKKMALDVNIYKLNKLVCDPFGGSDPGLTGGLNASLYYLDEGQPHYTSVIDYIEQGNKSDQNLFFSDLNVPTRRFELGFPSQTGEMIKKDDGSDLNEYFALEVKTILQLGPDDAEGRYELALLSDDGSILKVRNESGEYVVAVDNDHNHPTKMGCSSHVLDLTQGSQIPAKILYYQGPKYHISLIPMWRKLADDEEAGQDSRCGQSGNSLYFDYNNNSEPQAAYLELLERGWKPLTTANYQIPNVALFNPCVEGQAPVISYFSAQVDPESTNGIVVSWLTDIPATSQLRYVNLATGAEVVTDSDNILRTDHNLSVSGLEAGQTYIVQAISISETYGKALSAVATIHF